MGLHIVLFEPEIPANTGNIGRTCLATNTTLHLVHPLGFSLDEKMVRRAGLDYWEKVDIVEHDSMEDLYKKYSTGIFYYIENFGTKYYTDYDYSNPDEELFFVFGKESKGIPRELLKGKEKYCLRIHMNDHVRSLNLSNTAAIIIYEALRQQGFPGVD
ncbi:tRNA (uridine(34)/cytosine(34)/5-carboxymethylaminomethyluridine(34)-2'-O)-methyltransferase TrmL [Cerasibacillus terrae]|uniref:Putative tRNA (cytidine(34)-2'-O)-methyltransferase n=1 Tax=Cerasibacillus terrae TaxID=2498845 RepID=A0A5C8NTH3_9BACI|nr:tRNA (uridine(34)/cytosine(34)/5-carboxymethylaminomethyluridine(34)-2'-O)-methyltransferase TrmL [Cerasibacillus terrae]TXL63953.1 tRNA (uridine(34)/cytosine(34)/5-carboxymethylaminomethyluridine(34)-2'-O)-methyltransferase TrmL [Cerasibacillus terrae]